MKAVLYNRILLVLGFLGLFISGFLSLAHTINANVPCGASGGCEKVTNSPAASWGGIPVAYFGLLGYVILTGLALVRSLKGLQQTRGLVMPGYIVAAIGTVISLYLQYQALFVIRATCLWCLASALTMIATLVVYALLAQTTDTVGELPKDNAGVPMVGGLAVLTVLALAIGGFSLKASASQSATPEGGTFESRNVELIPANANSFGDPNAPITIIEFADIYCPACRTTSPKLHDFIAQNPGKIRMIYRHFPLMQKHPMSVPAALISEVAAEKGKFWDFLIAAMTREEVEAEQSKETLMTVAKAVGLDTADIQKRMDNQEDPIYQRLQRDMKAADRLGLNVTPSLIIQTKGHPDEFASSNDIWEKLQSSPYKEILNAKK